MYGPIMSRILVEWDRWHELNATIGWQNLNDNNGWLDEDDDEEPEEDEADEDNDEEMEEEDDEEEEEIVAEDEAEIIYPYDEADPNNRPPPASDDESEFAPSVIPVFDVKNRPVSHVIHFSSTYEMGESSSAREILKDIGEVYLLGPVPSTIGTAIRRIRKLNEKMRERAEVDKRIVKKIDRSDLRIRMVGRDAMSLDGAIRECQANVSKVISIMRLSFVVDRELPAKVNKARVIMSSATSAVTYTSVYTDSEPGRAFWGADDEGVSEGDIPRVIVLGYDGLQLQPVAPPSPNYIPGPENPPTPPVPQDEDEHEVERLLTMTTPSPSPPISLSPPSAGERLARYTAPHAHSPPLPPSSGYPTQIQTLRIASTQALIDAVTTALPPPPLPPLPPSLYIPPPVDHRDDIPESEQPPRKRLCLSTLGSKYEVGESSTARPTRGQGIDYGFVSTVDAEERRQRIRDVGYGIRGTWVDPAEAIPEIAPMTVGEVNTRVTKLAELHERDTQDLYALLEDAQDSRSRISQRVDIDSQRINLLMGDRMTLQETVWMAHQTQLQLQSTLIQTQHQVYETRFQMQQAELAALRETDRRRQDQMVETLRIVKDMRREMSDIQAELLALQEQQRRARQPGPEARIPDHQDASGDADSHI
ncbi:hypothetical protein Tco_1078635 [Tanacetum coccineum]|uniref:Uncharacterized protein n=1 Tax=Tanacetum coccineum TaxID=301880 RepID=A0ABQ5HR67_9ASTR